MNGAAMTTASKSGCAAIVEELLNRGTDVDAVKIEVTFAMLHSVHESVYPLHSVF